MRTVLLSALSVCLLTFSSCTVLRMGHVSYTYDAPPEQALPQEYTKIIYVFSGEGFDRTFSRLNVTIPGMQWIENEKDADIIVDLKLGESALLDLTAYEQITTTTNEAGVASSHVSGYTGSGTLNTPYHIGVYDQKTNVYYLKQDLDYSTPLETVAKPSVESARAATKDMAQQYAGSHRNDVGAHAKNSAEDILRKKFTIHPVTTSVSAPISYSDEPRIAEAYHTLHPATAENATRALRIYENIGFNNYTEKGELNDELNKGVLTGIAACYRILGDGDNEHIYRAKANALP